MASLLGHLHFWSLKKFKTIAGKFSSQYVIYTEWKTNKLKFVHVILFEIWQAISLIMVVKLWISKKLDDKHFTKYSAHFLLRYQKNVPVEFEHRFKNLRLVISICLVLLTLFYETWTNSIS